MSPQVAIADNMTQGRSPEELAAAVTEGLIIRDYLAEEISLGEVREKLGLQYIDDAMDWLHARGIATLRKLPDDLEASEENAFQKLKKEILP